MSTGTKKFEDSDWKDVVNGVLSKDILDNDSGFNIRFFKLKPNALLPFHTHSTKEYDYILEGSVIDETGNYNKGDLVVNEKDSGHSMKAGSEGCDFLVLWDER
jgi:anti-sigma factor ChrR (cupin superfamily)